MAEQDNEERPAWEVALEENNKQPFIFVFTQSVILSKLLDYLPINAIYKLRRTTIILNNRIDDSTMWRYINRMHFAHSPETLYKQSHLQRYICGNETQIGREWFTCTNSPVYKYTVCRICSMRQKVCKECTRRVVGERILCEECNEYVIICETCSHANPSFSLHEEFKVCEMCLKHLCTRHFVTDACNMCVIDSVLESDDAEEDIGLPPHPLVNRNHPLPPLMPPPPPPADREAPDVRIEIHPDGTPVVPFDEDDSFSSSDEKILYDIEYNSDAYDMV